MSLCDHALGLCVVRQGLQINMLIFAMTIDKIIQLYLVNPSLMMPRHGGPTNFMQLALPLEWHLSIPCMHKMDYPKVVFGSQSEIMVQGFLG